MWTASVSPSISVRTEAEIKYSSRPPSESRSRERAPRIWNPRKDPRTPTGVIGKVRLREVRQIGNVRRQLGAFGTAHWCRLVIRSS